MMRNFSTKKLIVCTAVLLLALLGGCNKYDDTDLKKSVGDLKERIEALEGQVKQINTDIASMNTIVKALESKVYVAKVEETQEGYTVYFTDNTKAVIKHGSNGSDAPVIGVKKDTDGVYYWTITADGKTDWLTDGGNKIRVTGESIKPVIAVDSEGFWTIGYGDGKTPERILGADGQPVSAVGSGSGSGSLFSSISHDDNNVYFRLLDGTMITVAKRSTFYVLIRKAPEQAPFVYGETQKYDIEAVGVEKVVITKPDEWHATYAADVLTITAPSKDHSTCCEKAGEVSLIYFGKNNESSVVSLKVNVDEDYRGETAGDAYTVNITDVTDKGITASVTPKDNSKSYYAVAYSADAFDKKGEAGFIAETQQMFSFYVQYPEYGYLDRERRKGATTYKPTIDLTPNTKFYLIVATIDLDESAKTCNGVTVDMKIPFSTKTPIVINTQYRIEVSDVSWFGAKYVTAPTDDFPYLHGFVKKADLEAFEKEEDFMKDYMAKLERTYKEELEAGTITWNDLVTTGAATVVSPSIEAAPLMQQTDYYAFAFGCSDSRTVTSPLSKTAFKTGKFTATQQCTFDVTATVDRQDVTVQIVPSDKNVSYTWSITKRSYYQGFGDDLSFAADDLFFRQEQAADNGETLDKYLYKGDQSGQAKNLLAATGYVVCVYGCTPEGIITTEAKVIEFVTKGTIDETDNMAPSIRNRASKIIPANPER